MPRWPAVLWQGRAVLPRRRQFQRRVPQALVTAEQVRAAQVGTEQVAAEQVVVAREVAPAASLAVELAVAGRARPAGPDWVLPGQGALLVELQLDR